MDEKKYVETTSRIMSDKTELTVNIDIQSAWLIISAIQLATRHPDLSIYMKKALTGIAKEFERRIVQIHPDADPLIRMGWDQKFDR